MTGSNSIKDAPAALKKCWHRYHSCRCYGCGSEITTCGLSALISADGIIDLTV